MTILAYRSEITLKDKHEYGGEEGLGLEIMRAPAREKNNDLPSLKIVGEPTRDYAKMQWLHDLYGFMVLLTTFTSIFYVLLVV